MGKYYTDPATGQRVEIQKTHKFRNFVVLPVAGLFALGIVMSAANSGGSTSQQPSTPNNAPVVPADSSATSGPANVEITGDGQAMVGTMTDGYTSNTVKLPATQQLPKGYASVTVTRTPSVESYRSGSGQGDSGTITCKITRDGKVVDTKTATGQYASVTCSKMY